MWGNHRHHRAKEVESKVLEEYCSPRLGIEVYHFFTSRGNFPYRPDDPHHPSLICEAMLQVWTGTHTWKECVSENVCERNDQG